jgi:hypothetical protein
MAVVSELWTSLVQSGRNEVKFPMATGAQRLPVTIRERHMLVIACQVCAGQPAEPCPCDVQTPSTLIV